MLTWEDFGDRLFRVLLNIEERVFLVIKNATPKDYRWVQFAATADSLRQEASPNDVMLEQYRLDEVGLATMKELGWLPPVDALNSNWHLDIPLPASSATIREAVDRSVTTLRDLFQVSSPEDLVFSAWRERELMQPDRLYYPEDKEALDPGENPLPLDLGIGQVPG